MERDRRRGGIGDAKRTLETKVDRQTWSTNPQLPLPLILSRYRQGGRGSGWRAGSQGEGEETQAGP